MTEPRTCCRTHWEADAGQHAVAVYGALWNPVGMTLIVCRTCGNKRCPSATDCGLECTGSNDPGQDGSIYGGLDEPTCEACGTPFAEHLGMMGTCKALQDSLAREANYREQIEALLKERDAAHARLAVKCKCPEAGMCERLWAADHDRAQLEAVDPALADEFPFGCDTVEHLAVALLAARAGKARTT